MIIASIDLQGGKVVQLRQGTELLLQRDDAEHLAAEFDLYGEVAVIDLDAAMNKGSNFELVKSLLHKACCRVGGGIRTAEQAKELVSLGAKKIIIGSVVFKDPAKKGQGLSGGEFFINIPLLEEFVKAIGQERLIVAVDSKNGEIVLDGWKTNSGLSLYESAKKLEPYVSELLFTCVEREGTMSGIDMEQVKELKKSFSKTITAAGGISTLEEIEELSALGCNAQLGMALYEGKIKHIDAFIHSLNWSKASDGLLPLIAQSYDGQVLMTGFTDREAVRESFVRSNLCFHSRSRNRLWMKGENSGNTLNLLRMRTDCDSDALLAEVIPSGPTCHTGSWSCFKSSRDFTWEYLQEIIKERFANPRPGSYTATLDDKLVREKIMEEADEVCRAETIDEKIWEAADLLYFTTVLISKEGISVEDVLNELERRHLK